MSLQPCNHQVSLFVFHEIEFEVIAVIETKPIDHTVTGILILIGNSRCLKEVNTTDMILGSV